MSTRGAWLVAALLAFGVVALASPAPADERYTPPDRPGPPLQVDAEARSASLHCPAPLAGLESDPVLLIAGTTLDPESNFSWNYIPAFEADGRAWCSVALPDNGMGDIQLAAEHVVHAIRTMAAEAGRRVDIVGFSQGGMIGRWALRFWPDTRDLVDDLVGIAPSNHGTDTAVATCQPACARSYQQQRSDAAFVEALNSYQETFAGISYTVVYTWADQIVAPNVGPDARSPLRDAHGAVTNVAVQDICPGHVADHFAIGSTDPVAYAVVTDALDNDGPADPTRIDPTVCVQPAMPGVDLATFPEGAARMLETVEHHNRTAERVPEEPPLQCYVLAACVAAAPGGDESTPDPAPAPEPQPAQSLPATGSAPVGLLVAVLVLGLLALGPAASAQDGPVVGTPPPQDALTGWIDNWMDPDFWSGYARELLIHGHVNLPYPFDPVKPEAYLPNVPVPDGEYVSALPVAHRDLSTVTYEWQGETKTIEQFVRTTRTDGIVLVHDGTVVGEWYANGYSPEVRHQPWSVTKTFVAAVVGIAYDEGLVGSLDDPIEAYIPELAGTAWEGVTVEQLLHMESGVHWDEDTPVLLVNTQVEQWIDLALDLYTEGQAGATRNEFLAALPPSYEPGTQFRYNSGNTQVLAWLTEVLYDATFNEVLAEKLWQPMGAAGDAVMTADRVGGVIASHGLFARPHDLARFGELLRNGGRTPEGHQVVPAAWVEAMIDMTEVSGGRYGYQTWAHPIAGEGAYSASGFQGQKITVVPDACLTGVRLSHALGARIRDGELTDPDAYGFGTEFFAAEWQTLLRAVADELGPCPERTPAAAPGAGVGALPVGQLPATGGHPLVALAGLGLLAAASRSRQLRQE